MSVAIRNVPTQVRVQLNNKKIVIPLIDGYLSLKVLKKYYPQASGITYYYISGETVAVQFIDEDRILINKSISTYDVFIPDTFTQSNISIAKKRRLDNMLKGIGCGKKMLQSRNATNEDKNIGSCEQEKFKRRVVNITWKHRKGINEKFKCLSDLAYKMKIDLNLNKDYTVTELTNRIVGAYLKPSIKYFFDTSRTQLGYGSFISHNKRNESHEKKHFKSIPSPPFSVITALKPSSFEKESSFNLSDYPSCSSLVNKDLPQNKEFRAPLPVPIKHATDMKSKLIKNTVQQLDLHLPDIKECDIKFSNIILGSGAQGIIRKATWAGTTVAVKTIKKQSSTKLTLREIKMLEKVRHGNFINVMALSSSPIEYHIVLEFFNGWSLQNIIFDKQQDFHLDPLKKNSIALQLCNAIGFIHSQKNPILHRDVKPGNVMVNKNCIVKVCDLGLSKSDDLQSNLLTTMDGIMRGTIMFLAPELLLLRENPTVKSDVWAVACTLVELYNEKNVWNVNYWSAHEDVKKYLRDKKIPDEEFPSFIKNSIKKCFDYDVNKRLSMVEMSQKYSKAKEFVTHRFFDF